MNGEAPGSYRNTPLWRLFDRVAQAVDHKRGWHRLGKGRLGTAGGLAVLVGVRNILRRSNLYDTNRAPMAAPLEPLPFEPRLLTERSADGSWNDLEQPTMGMAGARFGRNIPLEDTWPESEEQMLQPDPRLVSRKLLTRDEFVPATSVNALAAAWLQFMIRDWFGHGKGDPDRRWTIELAEDDPFPQGPIEIPRTLRDPTRNGDDGKLPPTFVNVETHWWDGSSLYGTSLEAQQQVRSGTDGKLIVGIDGRLPIDPTKSPAEEAGFWLGLLLLHTLFSREHNAICDRLKADHPTFDDEQLFQRARLINAALLAKIHTMEWTPAVISHPTTVTALRANWFGLAGEKIHNVFGRITKDEVISGIPGSETAHYGVPYSLTEEFTAVYRMHPLTPDDFTLRSAADDSVLAEKRFRELTGQGALDIDDEYDVTDLLYSFGRMHPGLVTLHNFPRDLQEFERPDGRITDLGAIDVLRVREIGVPRYCEFRRQLHLPVPSTFSELTDNPEWARQLEEVYGNVERVDTMIGMYAEPKPAGFAFSDTAFRIFVLMASRRLNSDRFLTKDFRREVYTQAGLDWIRDNQMGDVLLRHYPHLGFALRGLDNAFAPWAAAQAPA